MEKLLSLTEFAKMVNYSRRTIFKRIKDGTITPHLVRNGRNFFVEEQVSVFRTLDRVENGEKRRSYGYARVSSNGQKPQMEDQIKLIEIFSASKGMILDAVIQDVASGMNMQRKGFNRLVDEITSGLVENVIVTYDDRLMRFGFELLKNIAEKFGTEIIVINSKTTSPEEEMVEDLMTIVHVFSSRLYGLRSNRKKINELCRENKTQTG